MRKWKTRFSEATTSTVSDAKRTEEAATAVKSDNAILELLFCGLSGDKVERRRQSFGKIRNSEHVSINNISGRCTYTTHTGLSVSDFLSDVQIPIKKLTI